MNRLTLDTMTIYWLPGGTLHFDGGAIFGVVPKALWSQKLPANDKNQIQAVTDPILIQTPDRLVLLETGMGQNKLTEKQSRNFGLTKESTLDAALATLQLSANDIDTICLTHMHFDHACGLTKRTESGRLVSSFPRAKILISEAEWAEARKPNIRSKNTYWTDNWLPIADQVETFTNQTIVSPQISMYGSGGHSRGHAIIEITQADNRLLYMGDLMPTHAHVPSLWVSAYDDYPIESIAFKEAWIPAGIEADTTFLFYHDTTYRAIKLNKSGEITWAVKRDVLL